MRAERSVLGFLEGVAYGGRRTPFVRLVNVMLIGLSWLYRAAIGLYLLPFKIGLRRTHRLGCPVISVGNMTVGGTGKTPMVRHICRMLLSAGLRPAVLSYGYGGSLRGRFGIVSDGSNVLLSHLECGDEPAMLAKSLPGVPVLVGKDRVRTGRVAINEMGANVLVLDDGFQVWKLHRDLDVVLLRADRPFDNGRALPAGRLREPMTAISRADCVILTGRSGYDVRENALKAVRVHVPEMPVFSGWVEPSSLVSLVDSTDLPLDSLRDARVLALSGIANPASFEETLEDAGAVIVARERFPDHYVYSSDDIVRVSQSAQTSGADLMVTTEKDAVRLGEWVSCVRAVVLRTEVEIEGEEALKELIDAAVAHADHAECASL